MEDRSLMDALVQVSFGVMATLTQVAAALDLSLTQLRLLAILEDREPTMSALADFLGLDRSSVSGLVDRAAKRGLVERVASEVDKRSSRVTLTDAGRELIAAGVRDGAARLDPMLADLSASERADLARLLVRTLP